MREHILRFMTATFSALFLAAGCSMSALASDYKPMIRYDRVWENVTYDQPYDIIKCMKFDGTEEINGKTWHRIVTFIKTYVKGPLPYTFTTDYDVYENEGYLREEDGLVYTLVDRYSDDNSKEHYGELYLSSAEAPRNDIVEALIYNFNCREGEDFEATSFITLYAEQTDFRVVSESTVEIEGEECRRFAIQPAEYYHEYNPGVPYIEGIGIVEQGCLNYTEFIMTPAMMWYHKYFLRAFNMNGNVIFVSDYSFEDGFNVPYSGFGSVETLTEGSRLLIGDGTVSFGEDGHDNGVQLYDAGGRAALSASSHGRVCLTTDRLAPGIYIAVATTDGRVCDRRKVMVRLN